jgi:hypothetical protein
MTLNYLGPGFTDIMLTLIMSFVMIPVIAAGVSEGKAVISIIKTGYRYKKKSGSASFLVSKRSQITPFLLLLLLLSQKLSRLALSILAAL